MDEKRLELKVGVLVLAAALGVLGLLTLMGEISFGAGHVVTVNFSHTGSVVKGAPVKLSGVVVGKVQDIELVPGRVDAAGALMPVRMRLSVSKEAGAALRTDAMVTVPTQGPLGEPYLELWQGTAQAPLGKDTELRGVDAPRLDIITNQLARFLEVASLALEKDPDSLGKLIKGLGGLTTAAGDVLVDNREDLRSMAQELSAAAKDLRQLAAAARADFEPGGKADRLLDDAAVAARVARTDLPELSKKASIALGGLANVSGQFTPEDGQKLKAALARLDTIATRADGLLKKLEAGEGTAGALLKDKQAYDDLKSLLADLRKHPWKMLWKD